jgi:rhodanese-related sulfurtransferase
MKDFLLPTNVLQSLGSHRIGAGQISLETVSFFANLQIATACCSSRATSLIGLLRAVSAVCGCDEETTAHPIDGFRPARAGGARAIKYRLCSFNYSILMKKLKFTPLLLRLALFAMLTVNQLPAQPAPHGEKSPVAKGVKNVGVEEFDKLRAGKNAVVLDVRTEKEFNSGHIPGAINLDYNSPDFGKKVGELDKSKTYLVHCAGGVRSAKACSVMDKIAFTNVVNLAPGFKGWEKSGKPVEKK